MTFIWRQIFDCWLCPCRIKCSQTDGNGVPAKRTVLHDLYEKQGQSPWYDNLCRPVTDLIPLIESGVRGVTSNPAVIILWYLIRIFLPPSGKRLV